MAEKQKPITDEIASAATDFDIFQGFMTHLANPDKVLALECGGDITVYDDMSRDDRIGPSLRTRALAVIGREWEVTPFSDKAEDMLRAEYVKQVFLGFPFDRARRALLRGGTLKGFALSEVMWDYSEGDVFIKDMRHRNQRRFRFDLEGNILLITRDNPMGENVSTREGLPLRKFQHVTFGDEVETPYGVGLGRELYWPWWFKKNGIKFWLMFCDKFAGPTVKGEYPAGATEEQKNSLLSAAQAVHSNNAVIFPQGMSLSLLEAARSGSITTYKELVEYMDAAMTVVILGQTATTEGTPGALGNQDAQADVRGDLVKADADALSEALNSENGVVRWLVDYQFPGTKKYPQIWIKTEDEDDELTVAGRDEKRSNAVAASGARLTPVYFKRRYNLEGDEIETTPQPPPESGGVARQGAGDGISLAEPGNDPTATVSALTDRLGKAAAPQTDAWIDALKKRIGAAESIDELPEIILAAYPDMSVEALAGIVAEETMRAFMAGRIEAESGE
jgi:phage gp29-like protein